ncbi:hypothetical protein PoB_001305300 [Plakobranchus ocellatus]|uniref:MADF domain-containing protein n=1 Tax=Plakobranchus ocellatus TaxID=259542 RepID=A0AAV3YVX1_9GAST|nr:hypothetical protein PoB_001305300 [Plakobranchus ocellatus]
MPAHQVLNLISLVKENFPRLDGRFKGAGLGEVTNSQKRELWNEIVAQIHATDPTFEKKDLRHQAMCFRTALSATGGGPPTQAATILRGNFGCHSREKGVALLCSRHATDYTIYYASDNEFTEKLFLHLQYLTLAWPLHQFLRRLPTPPIPEETLPTSQKRAQPQQGASSPIVIDEQIVTLPCEPCIAFDISEDQSTTLIEPQITSDPVPAKVHVINSRRRRQRSMMQGQDDPKWEKYLDAMIEERG